MTVLDATGRELLVYPPADWHMPVRRIIGSAGFDQLYVAAREGMVIRLALERSEEALSYKAQTIYEAKDIHTISLSAQSQLLAVGHLGPGLAVLRTDGEVLWRRHPDEGNATEARLWSVALDAGGEYLYVGSATSGTNRLAALEPRSASVCAYQYVEGMITRVTVLPNTHAVAVTVNTPSSRRLVVYTAALDDVIWERSFDVPVTALTADAEQPLLFAGVGYGGEIAAIDAHTGRTLASGVVLKSTINELAVAQAHTLVAACQNGQVAFVDYISQEFHL
ncbi:MAG: PQQ-binding-like beta-propeller repeat protein [Anaerolineae bacterium]|nr:PQQ-binding-like beta-propeller repeat protein [Anaerolineae bacterium]